jgi:hypothetical protein
MSKPSIIDNSKPKQVVDDVSAIFKIKQIDKDGGVELFEYGGSNHDIYNNYELSSNIRAKSYVTFDSNEVPHPDGIDARDILYVETTHPQTGEVPNLFQIVHRAGGETYLALNILEETVRVEFYDRSNTLVGFFHINRTDYPSNKKIQFYWRAYQKEIDGINDRISTIDLNNIVVDDTVDYIGGSSVLYDIPITSDFYEAQLTNNGILRPESRNKLISPVRKMSFETTSSECSRMKSLFMSKFSNVYQDSVTYLAGDVVIEKGKRYVAQSKCVNKKPIESIIWKEI